MSAFWCPKCNEVANPDDAQEMPDGTYICWRCYDNLEEDEGINSEGRG